ncbi:MAG: hypothetical protein ACIWVG_25675 [Gloeotrichia echinulata HAB0833]
MLTLEPEEILALDYPSFNTSIKDTFAAIDRFEWQAIEEVQLMRDNCYLQDAGYTNFGSYCKKELTRYGRYRRVRDLLAEFIVVDTPSKEAGEQGAQSLGEN